LYRHSVERKPEVSEEHIASISGSKRKPRKKPAEAGGKLVKAITTNIHVNRMATRLEGNIGKYGVVGIVRLGGVVEPLSAASV
jgi:hypothetical protein